jgi:hypothetical protein
MKNLDCIRYTTLLALLVAIFVPATAQENAAQGAASGTEYYIGFMQNDDVASGAISRFMGLMITSQVATVGTVEIPGQEPRSFSTRPGEYTTISVPRPFEHTISEDTVGNPPTSVVEAVRVTSRAPVTVFVLDARHQSTFGYAAVPTSHWGTHYVPLTLPNALGARTSQLMIVAGYDDTWIRFVPSTQTVRQLQGIPRDIKLDKGRTYFVQAEAGSAGIADLSGSEIFASRPVGVIAGHVRTPITLDGSIPSDPQAYATHQSAMMLPDSLWGLDFASVPMRASGDRFRIMPSRDARIIVTHYGPAGIGRDTLALDAGEVRDLASVDGALLNGPIHLQSTAPTMVLQLRTGGRYGDPSESPAMMPLTSLGSMASRSAFVAIGRIADGSFSKHRLSLIVKMPEDVGGDMNKAFRAIELDGTPIESFAPGGEPRAIGATGLSYATIEVSSGGHLLTATAGVTFAGSISGDNGSLYRDSYLFALPTWGEPTEFDYTSPYIVSVDVPMKGTVEVAVSDFTSGYFSGVGDVQAAGSSSGWIRSSFAVPMPNETASATFRAIADPSGPLTITISDRDGNARDTVVHGTVCFKTAVATEPEVEVRATVGTVGTGSIELSTNQCGDAASIRSITFGEGPVAVHLSGRFDNGLQTTTIAPFERARLTVAASSSLAVGTYQTTMRVVADDSTIVVRVRVVIEPPSAVASESATSRAMRVYPNPVASSAVIEFGHVPGSGATLSVTDNLGRVVRTFSSDEVGGRSRVVWDGRDALGATVPAGVYMLLLDDRSDRTVSGVTVVR